MKRIILLIVILKLYKTSFVNYLIKWKISKKLKVSFVCFCQNVNKNALPAKEIILTCYNRSKFNNYVT